MMHPTNPTGYFNIPEPPLEPPEYDGPHYCERCERPLDTDDPHPLCRVCAREED